MGKPRAVIGEFHQLAHARAIGRLRQRRISVSLDEFLVSRNRDRERTVATR